MGTILFLLLLFPLAGGFFHAVLGRRVPRRVVETVACAAVIASFVMAVIGFIVSWDKTTTVAFFRWIGAGDFFVSMDAYYDPLAAVMALMVTFVSSIIHIYSVAYMREDEDYARYFCYLNLFVFSMLVITLADNLLFLFLGWEGVGFCSYALIGFWYGKLENALAGRKAFLLTRIGDVAFGVAIGLFFVTFNSLSIPYINAHSDVFSVGSATVLGLLLLSAAVGKSAQLPLVVWLPDAMAGPTPVSALIHAATMVTAGVYLLMRLFPVVHRSPTAMLIVTAVGAITAFYAACAALSQQDIKRVLAYSTISQVGYMFMGVGAGDVIGGMFHLLSHAFFKSLLFLAAGCVIQALHEEHDIFKMGSEVRKRLPAVFWLFLAGAVSLSGEPLTAGYFSKDRILLATIGHPGTAYKVLWGVGTATAFLTVFYTFRLFFLTFTGEPYEKRGRPVGSIPRLMTVVLWPLAILSLFVGFMNFPILWSGGEWLARFLASTPGSIPFLAVPPSLDWQIAILDMIISVGALVIAYFIYGPPNVLGWRRPVALGQTVHNLAISGFYLDRLYAFLIGRPYRALAGFLWRGVDDGGVDRTLVSSGKSLTLVSVGLRLWTTGKLSTYLNMLLLGLTVLVCILVMELYGG